MRTIQITFVCALLAIASAENAKNCDQKECVLPKCHCSDLNAPITEKIPQFVSLSFDDSASKLIYDEFYQKELFHRKNPDGCPICGTFFVTHEYTDYTVVNTLYNKGFEIGSHSITKNFSTKYWNTASEETIINEMGGQRQILAKFANIPIDNIYGARIPHFALNAENTFNGLQKAGFLYDNSWPTYSFKQFFPYTLDYSSEQPCFVGSCPKESIPGMWVLPIINWIDMDKEQCNKLLACVVEGTAEEIFEWMKLNFEANYKNNRAPVNLVLNYAWFNFVENSAEALTMFLDYLATLEDVFIVSENQVLDWMENPVNLKDYISCKSRFEASCKPKNCKLIKEDGAERWMGSCVACPKNYPSINNPEGN